MIIRVVKVTKVARVAKVTRDPKDPRVLKSFRGPVTLIVPFCVLFEYFWVGI